MKEILKKNNLSVELSINDYDMINISINNEGGISLYSSGIMNESEIYEELESMINFLIEMKEIQE